MRSLLMLLNPRTIEECVASYEALDIDMAWLVGYSLTGLVPAVAEVVEESDHDVLLMSSDDCVVTQEALDAVLGLVEAGHPVVTGWCRLDMTSPLSNLTDRPFTSRESTVEAYSFRRADEVRASTEPSLMTGFVGLAFTAMRRDLWQRFPFGFDRFAPDFELSWRLQDAGIPMVGARDGEVWHVKEHFNRGDIEPRKRLRLLKDPYIRMTARTA